MEERIKRIIEAENITPAKFAEVLGVQRSAISHILTGRNKPSFELILKIITKYPAINAEWLIAGRGEMRKVIIQGSLFDKVDTTTSVKNNEIETSSKVFTEPECVKNDTFTNVNNNNGSNSTSTFTSFGQKETIKKIVKIVVLYSDSTFDAFTPSNYPVNI